MVDNRVHCCFYLISPHGLKPLDVDYMRRLSNKVNIVPVIAKSECLTMAEIEKLKIRILEEIEAAGIRIYPLPYVDNDEDEEYKVQVSKLRESVPFAVCGANAKMEVAGKMVNVRNTRFGGVVQVDNPAHTDNSQMRSFLNMVWPNLQQVTHNVHYENFRSDRLIRTAAAATSSERQRWIQMGWKPGKKHGIASLLQSPTKRQRREEELETENDEQSSSRTNSQSLSGGTPVKTGNTVNHPVPRQTSTPVKTGESVIQIVPPGSNTVTFQNIVAPQADEPKAVKFSHRSLGDLLLGRICRDSRPVGYSKSVRSRSVRSVDDKVDNVKLGALEDEEKKPCESKLQQDRVRREQIEFLMNFELRPIKDTKITSKKEKLESTKKRPRRSGRIANKKC